MEAKEPTPTKGDSNRLLKKGRIASNKKKVSKVEKLIRLVKPDIKTQNTAELIDCLKKGRIASNKKKVSKVEKLIRLAKPDIKTQNTAEVLNCLKKGRIASNKKKFSKVEKLIRLAKPKIMVEEGMLDEDPAKKEQEIKESGEQGSYLYVYGVTKDEPLELDMTGLKGKPIFRIKLRNILALVSSYPFLNPMPKDDALMEHAEILKKITEKANIIPMSFGIVFKNEKILKNVLSKAYLTIKKTLESIDGKIEMGVKVVKKGVCDQFNGEKLEILESLKQLSVKDTSGSMFSDWLLLNHSFLVERGKFEAFSEKIAGLESKYGNLRFLYTGPWPPYSFVNIRIGGD